MDRKISLNLFTELDNAIEPNLNHVILDSIVSQTRSTLILLFNQARSRACHSSSFKLGTSP